jgi:GTP pyrophosphokinase
VLGAVHSQWSYVKKEFDDYIASPKDNGYQSIHTVIIGPEGNTIEIQIRTPDMHYNSEYGVAAHWRYKEGGKGFDEKLERSISSIRQMLGNTDDPEIFKEISTELQSQHVFVMTPTNDIITLNQGATPLDFAYNIHTELGHRCRGAKINGRIKNPKYRFKDR